MVKWQCLWEQRSGRVTPFVTQETEEGAWRLMRDGRIIDNRNRGDK
jgi:hypothetical protein